jgi:tetratricopeptide (TPR) repeat protein
LKGSVLDSDLISGLVTVVSLGFATYQTYQAKQSDKKVEANQTALSELEKNLVTSDLKLVKAIEFYENGQFTDSLKAFKGYIKDSDDASELLSAVNKIFWKESRKIYGKFMPAKPSGLTVSILVTTVIAKHDDDSVTEKYPDFLVQLLEAASIKSSNNLSNYKVPVYLNRGEYEKAIENLGDLKAQVRSKKANEAFREFIKLFCERMGTLGDAEA